MNFLARLFRETLPAPTQPRDIDGRYLPHRLAVRSRAIEMAANMGRMDLIDRILKPTALPPALLKKADRDFGLTRSPAGTSVEAGQGNISVGANDRDVATFNFGDTK